MNNSNFVRNHSIDSVCGLMIVFMIFYHINGLCHMPSTEFKDALYPALNCFMPWFFFKSGMFFRPCNFKELIKKDFHRLLIPYIVFSLIGWIVYLCLNMSTDFSLLNHLLFQLKHFATHGDFMLNTPLWFLLSLFFARLIFNFIVKRQNLKWYIIILLILYLALSYFQIWSPKYVKNTMSGTLFLAMGFYMKNKQYDKRFFILASAVFVFFLTKYECYVIMNYNILKSGDYFCWLISSGAAIVFYNNMFRIIESIKPSRILDYIGRHSMTIYCTHWLVIQIALELIPNEMSTMVKFFCIIVICIIVLPLLDRFFHIGKLKMIIGEKC